jgi:hypothetical protein
VPSAQLTHEDEAEAPELERYVPIPQLTQLDEPIDDTYLPAEQLVQTAEEEAACAAEYDPMGQLTHMDAPMFEQYCPVGHEKHEEYPLWGCTERHPSHYKPFV